MLAKKTSKSENIVVTGIDLLYVECFCVGAKDFHRSFFTGHAMIPTNVLAIVTNHKHDRVLTGHNFTTANNILVENYVDAAQLHHREQYSCQELCIHSANFQQKKRVSQCTRSNHSCLEETLQLNATLVEFSPTDSNNQRTYKSEQFRHESSRNQPIY